MDHHDLLTTHEAADAARCHVVTIRKALLAAQLHGNQRTEGGRWLIERRCLEAWSSGSKCVHAAPRSP